MPHQACPFDRRVPSQQSRSAFGDSRRAAKGPPQPPSSSAPENHHHHHHHAQKRISSEVTRIVHKAADCIARAKFESGRATPETTEAALAALDECRRLQDIVARDPHATEGLTSDLQLEKLWGSLIPRLAQNKVDRRTILSAVQTGLTVCRKTFERRWGDGNGMVPSDDVPQNFSIVVNNLLSEETSCVVLEMEKSFETQQGVEYAALWSSRWASTAKRTAWINHHARLDEKTALFYRLSYAHHAMSFARVAPKAGLAMECVSACLDQLHRCGKGRVGGSGVGFVGAGFATFFLASHGLWRERSAALAGYVANTVGDEKFGHLREVKTEHYKSFGDAVSHCDKQPGLPSVQDIRMYRTLALLCFDVMLSYNLKIPARTAKHVDFLSKQLLYHGDDVLHVYSLNLLFRASQGSERCVGYASNVALALYNRGSFFAADAWIEEAAMTTTDEEVNRAEYTAYKAFGKVTKNRGSEEAQNDILRSLDSVQEVLRGPFFACVGGNMGVATPGADLNVQLLSPRTPTQGDSNSMSEVDEAKNRLEEVEATLRTCLTTTCLSVGSTEAALVAGEDALGAFFRTDPLLERPADAQKKNSLTLLNNLFSLLHAHTEVLIVRGEVDAVHRLLAQALKIQVCNSGSFSPVHTAWILYRRGQCQVVSHSFHEAALSLRCAIKVLEGFIDGPNQASLRASCYLLLSECFRKSGDVGAAVKTLDRLEQKVLPSLALAQLNATRRRPWASPNTVHHYGLDEIAHIGLDFIVAEDVAFGTDHLLAAVESFEENNDFCRNLQNTASFSHDSLKASILAAKALCAASSSAPLETQLKSLESRRCRVNARVALSELEEVRPDWNLAKRHSPRSNDTRGHLRKALYEAGRFQGPFFMSQQVNTELSRRSARQDETQCAHYLNASIGCTVRHQLEGVVARKGLAADRAAFFASKSGLAESFFQQATKLSGRASFSSTGSAANPAGVTDRLRVLLPSCFAVVTMKLAEDGHLIISRLEADYDPVVIGIANAQIEVSSATSELASVLKSAKTHLEGVDHSRISDNSYKQEWWNTREQLDLRIKTVVEKLGDELLHNWRGMLVGGPLSHAVKTLLSTVEEKVYKALFAIHSKMHPSGRVLDRNLIRILLSSVPKLYDGLRDDAQRKNGRGEELYWKATTSIVYHALHDVLGVDPPVGGQVSEPIRNVAKLIHVEVAKVLPLSEKIPRQHVLLVLGGALHRLPWESCSAMENEAVSRIPSLHYLLQKLESSTCGEVLHREFDSSKVFYMLNPDGNLKRTESKFEWFKKEKGWSGQVGTIAGTTTPAAGVGATAPRNAEGRAWRETWLGIMRHGVRMHDVFLYLGHGTGEQFVALKDLRRFGAAPSESVCAPPACLTPRSAGHRLSTSRTPVFERTPANSTRCLYDEMLSPGESPRQSGIRRTSTGPERGMAVCFMMGCSSGSLGEASGEVEPYGVPYALLVTGAPAVVANLWDVTDGEIDRFTAQLLKSWLKDVNTLPLAEAMNTARKHVKLRYLIGSCPVMYGLPVNPRLG